MKSEYVGQELLFSKYGMLGLWEELILRGLEMLESLRNQHQKEKSYNAATGWTFPLFQTLLFKYLLLRSKVRIN